MDLIDFWPPNDLDHTGECFFTDAESANPAVFLAVHQPMTLEMEIFGSTNIKPSLQTESQLLETFLDPNPDSGICILPIIGDSGVGKSHMIAWIDANLKLREDSQNRHIVRIPKSASLRTVLTRILKGLPTDDYDELNNLIASAKLTPTLQKATGLLEVGLRNELERIGVDASKRIDANQAKPGDLELQSHCHPNCLIALLKDPSIQEYFSCHADDDNDSGVLTRIADRCLNGTKGTDSGPQNEFFEKDFDFIKKIETQNLARPTEQYLKMLRVLPEGIKVIVGILNGVVDSALADLIDLGTITLSDVFQDIRRRLLRDGKELVILVEDFAVLAGIQEPLLTAMLQEADPGGKQELCTMRTALAVTEGRLMKETVMTRAKASWKIQTRPFTSDAQAIEVFKDFIGGYLNAARYGSEELERLFKTHDPGTDLRAWVPNYYEENADSLGDEDRVKLDAFERSPTNGHALFPLNPGAVHQLVRHYSGDESGIRFEPRKLIHYLLRETVGKNRLSFESGTFPPVDFHHFKFSDLDLSLHPAIQAHPNDLDRVGATVRFWGDNPATPAQAATKLNKHIIESFELPIIDWGDTTNPVKVKPSLNKTKPPIKDEVPLQNEPHSPIEGEKYKRLLDQWQKQGTITQKNSNLIRGILEDGINAWVDSNKLLEKEVKVARSKIYIPLSDQGIQDADASVVVVARDSDLDDPNQLTRFFTDIRACLRFKNQQGWDYEGSEGDFSRYANLIETLAGQLLARIREEGIEKNFPRTNIAPLARALLLNARLLNLKGASSNKEEDNLSAMLTVDPTEKRSHLTSDDQWINIKDQARAARPEMIERLLKHTSSRQGTGDTQAIDASVLLQAVRSLKKADWELADDSEINWVAFDRATKDHLKALRTTLPKIVAAKVNKVNEWRMEVVEAFGDNVDWLTVQQQLVSTVTAANRIGKYSCDDTTAEALKQRITACPSITEPFNDSKELADLSGQFGRELMITARLDETKMKAVHNLICTYRNFLKETNESVEVDLKDAPANPEETAATIENRFEELSEEWNRITQLCK